MGLFGLRRFIDASGCTFLLPVPLNEEEEQCVNHNASFQNENNTITTEQEGGYCVSSQERHNSICTADHVLIDLNCIVHSCLSNAASFSNASGNDISSSQKHHDAHMNSSSKERISNACIDSSITYGGKSKKDVIAAVLYRIEVLLTRVVSPVKSLTLCLDGPPPLAKIQTQRLRRRKVTLMDSQVSSSSALELNALAITAGSLFMVELENEIAAVFKKRQGKGFLWNLCPVFLHGTTVMGEGESKISRALFHLAYGDVPHSQAGHGELHEKRYPSALGYQNHGPPPYNPNDTVVVVGNDIDLVMTCLGSTFYHNISVLSPASLQVINVSDMLYRWIKASGNANASAARITLEDLPSLRIDFMFLFLLNGGDHYTGAGDVAMGLWQRYKTVRSAALQRRSGQNSKLLSRDKKYGSKYRFSLVGSSLDHLNIDILADTLQADDYAGEADAAVGIRLLQSALWSLYTTVTGVCPDYRYLPSQEDQPTLSHLRAAAALCKKKKRSIHFPFVPDSAPLSPLEHYVALMPTTAAMPKGVAATLRQPGLKKIAHILLNSNDPKEIAPAAEKAVEASSVALRHSESYLRQFTSPVQLNVLPPRKRLSRHEQHRMMAMANKQADRSGKPSLPLMRVEDPEPVVRVIHPPAMEEKSTPVVSLHYPSFVKGFVFTSPFDKWCQGGLPVEQESGMQEGESHPPQKKSRTQEWTRDSGKYVPFGLWDTTPTGVLRGTHAPNEGDGGISAKLDHSLAIAERLEAKGHHGAAQGKKMRKKLWKAQAAVERALREGASKDDWKYTISTTSEGSSTTSGSEANPSSSSSSPKMNKSIKNKKDHHKMILQDDFHDTLSNFLGDDSAIQKLLQESNDEGDNRVVPPVDRQKKTRNLRTQETPRREKRLRSSSSFREGKKLKK